MNAAAVMLNKMIRRLPVVSEGKLVDARGSRARYVRLYSNGSNANELNHYIEVEVFGRPAK